MAKKFVALTPQFAREVREVVREVASQILNPQRRPDVPDETFQSPDVYIAYTSNGIPAILEPYGTGSGSSDFDQPSSDVCSIYQIITTDPITGTLGLEEVPNFRQTVFNISHASAVPPDTFFVTARDKYGRWLALSYGDGSSGYLAVTTSPITARVGAQFGQGTAELQSIPGGLLTDAGTPVEIYNKFAHVIPVGVVVTLNRDPYTGLLWVVEPDAVLKTDCFGGYLAILQSVDGGNTFNFLSYIGGCASIVCPACGSGSGSGSGCCDNPYVCVSFAGIGNSDENCTALMTPVTLTFNSINQTWVGTAGSFTVVLFCTNGLEDNGYEVDVYSSDTMPPNELVGVFAATGAALTWDCKSVLTIPRYGNPTVGCTWPNSVTITPGACSGSGSGSGGGNIFRVSLGTASASGTAVTSVTATIPDVTVPTGMTLLVQVGLVTLGEPGLGPVVTFDASGLSERAAYTATSSPFTLQTSIWQALSAGSTTTGDIVVTVANADPFTALLLVSAEYESLNGNIDQDADNGGLASTPNSGTTATTTTANEYAEAAFMLLASSAGTWGGGFTSGGQDVSGTLSGSTFVLTEGYEILSAIQTVTATMTGSTTAWSGCVATFK